MNDCRKRAESDMGRNKKQLEELIKGLRSIEPGMQRTNEQIENLSSYTTDLEYVLEELAKLGLAIDGLQDEVGVENAILHTKPPNIS